MTKGLWLTPEEMVSRKKRKKNLLYVSLFLGTIILSAFVTILTNQL